MLVKGESLEESMVAFESELICNSRGGFQPLSQDGRVILGEGVLGSVNDTVHNPEKIEEERVYERSGIYMYSACK